MTNQGSGQKERKRKSASSPKDLQSMTCSFPSEIKKDLSSEESYQERDIIERNSSESSANDEEEVLDSLRSFQFGARTKEKKEKIIFIA